MADEREDVTEQAPEQPEEQAPEQAEEPAPAEAEPAREAPAARRRGPVSMGRAYIKSSFNNTLISIADQD